MTTTIERLQSLADRIGVPGQVQQIERFRSPTYSEQIRHAAAGTDPGQLTESIYVIGRRGETPTVLGTSGRAADKALRRMAAG